MGKVAQPSSPCPGPAAAVRFTGANVDRNDQYPIERKRLGVAHVTRKASLFDAMAVKPSASYVAAFIKELTGQVRSDKEALQNTCLCYLLFWYLAASSQVLAWHGFWGISGRYVQMLHAKLDDTSAVVEGIGADQRRPHLQYRS